MRGDEPTQSASAVMQMAHLPHMRGDEPLAGLEEYDLFESAPHAWG